jgi:hypothetical protein
MDYRYGSHAVYNIEYHFVWGGSPPGAHVYVRGPTAGSWRPRPRAAPPDALWRDAPPEARG